MSVSIDDLKPKTFKVIVNDVELVCQPVRMKHALILAKVGNTFENASNASDSDIDKAQEQVDKVFGELIPEINGMDLDMQVTMSILEQIMEHIAPDDNKELSEKGVSLGKSPKA